MLETNSGYGEVSQSTQKINTPSEYKAPTKPEDKPLRRTSEENKRACNVRREIERRRDERLLRKSFEF